MPRGGEAGERGAAEWEELRRLLLRQEAAVAELEGQEARYAAMLAALQETVGRAVAETAASRAQLVAGEVEPASAAAATTARQAHLKWDQIVFEMFYIIFVGLT